MTLRVLSLFSGIGGLELGLERAGMLTVGQCEMDPFARAVLEKHWPGIPRWTDVRYVAGQSIRRACGRVDAVAGGFPCQDISSAGKGAGLGTEDDPTGRSGLWFEMLRVIRRVRPRWVVAENVPALRSRGADVVLGGLEAAGYSAWPLVVGADDVGASHRRKRVFIVARRVADSDGARREAPWRGHGIDDGRQPEPGCRALADAERHESERRGGCCELAGAASSRQGDGGERQRVRDAARDGRDAVADSDRAGRERERGGGLLDGERAALGYDVDGCDATLADTTERGRGARERDDDAGRRQPDATRGGALPVWPPGPRAFAAWGRVLAIEPGLAPAHEEAQPALRGVAHGLPPRLARRWRRHALRCFGNAVVPQVATVIGRAIVAAESTP